MIVIHRTAVGRTSSFTMLMGALLVSSAAHAQLFVSNYNTGVNNAYDASGSPIFTINGQVNPSSIAISGSDLYVASSQTGAISEYDFNGNTVSVNLIGGR
jgi:hypothetical protein